MRSLFLDTSYLIALEVADDQHHAAASRQWREMGQSLPLLVTTSYVFDEVVTFFNRRKHHAKAVEVGNLLLESPSVKLVHVDEALFREAWRYFSRHSDKSYSLTDCVSFVLMRRLRMRGARAFDKHFTQAGLEQKPGD